MNIGPLAIGSGQPCRFIAEISNNHNGDERRALRLIAAAADAGADAIKFQCYTPDELVALRGDGPAPKPWGAQGWTMRTLYEKAQTPILWFPRLIAECEMLGLPWFSSVFGGESLLMLEQMGCPVYKIARLDNTQATLLNAVRATGKPVFVSSNRWWDSLHDFSVLYCPPGYPVKATDVHLPLFGHDHVCGQHSYFIGLSSHCLAPELPVAAVARGAKLLEYHIQLADEPSELEANVSLDEHQFKAMVASVRMTETLCGL